MVKSWLRSLDTTASLYFFMAKYTKPIMVGRVGIEPTKAKPKDLQSSPFDHSGTDP